MTPEQYIEYRRDARRFSASKADRATLALMASAPHEIHDWRELAACAQVDGELFFPIQGGSARAAKQVCGRCEVRDECLEYAMAHQEPYGVWGGLSEWERRLLRWPALRRNVVA